MSAYQWQKDPMQVVIQFESRSSVPGKRAESGALIAWAAWTVDSLYYLNDLIAGRLLETQELPFHDPATKQVAHLRWSAGTAITALNLCAAAAAREHGFQTRTFEYDCRDLNKKIGQLPDNLRDWLNDLLTDPSYQTVLYSRNPLTHARLKRHFTTSTAVLSVEVRGSKFSIDEIISMANDLATVHVQKFLNIVDSL